MRLLTQLLLLCCLLQTSLAAPRSAEGETPDVSDKPTGDMEMETTAEMEDSTTTPETTIMTTMESSDKPPEVPNTEESSSSDPETTTRSMTESPETPPERPAPEPAPEGGMTQQPTEQPQPMIPHPVCPDGAKCFYGPTDCKDKDKDCRLFFQFEIVNDTHAEGVIRGGLFDENWMAVGFSRNGDMADSFVIYCERHGDVMTSGVGYNYMANGKRGNIKSGKADSDQIHTHLEGSVDKDDVAYCRFHQLIAPTGPRSDNANLFSLNTEYRILMASGPVKMEEGFPLGGHHTTFNTSFQNLGKVPSLTSVKSFDHGSCNGNKKRCFYLPTNCAETATECEVIFSYDLSKNTKEAEIELIGKMNTERWMAAGFSTDENMGEDIVLYCERYNNSQIYSGVGFNYFDKTVNKPRNQKHTNTSSEIQMVVENYVNAKDDFSYCHFRQQIEPLAPACGDSPCNRSDHANAFPLNKPYHLVLVGGPIRREDGRPFGKHDKMNMFDVNLNTRSEPKMLINATVCNMEGEKKCLFWPTTCESDIESCNMIFTFKPLNTEFATIEIYGPLKKNSWMAVGLSNDEKMGEDLTLFCERDETFVTHGVGYTSGPDNKGHMKSDKSAEIQRGLFGSSIASSKGDEEKTYCIFNQMIAPTGDRPDHAHMYPLNKEYSILMAKGPLQGREFGKHDKVTNEFKMNFGGAPEPPMEAEVTEGPSGAVGPGNSAPATSSILSIASVVALYLLAH